LAIGVWLTLAATREAPDAGQTTAAHAKEPSPRPANPAASDPLPPPDYHIAEGGRLHIAAGTLPKGEVLTLGLALPEDAHGGEPLPVRVASDDGRRFDTIATPAAGPQRGLRLEIESDWLNPGLYMIQVSTNERTPLALRRYVLEIE
jgi:hypothetical protein